MKYFKVHAMSKEKKKRHFYEQSTQIISLDKRVIFKHQDQWAKLHVKVRLVWLQKVFFELNQIQHIHISLTVLANRSGWTLCWRIPSKILKFLKYQKKDEKSTSKFKGLTNKEISKVYRELKYSWQPQRKKWHLGRPIHTVFVVRVTV